MQNPGAREPATNQMKKPSPGQGSTLAPSPKGAEPIAKDLTAEGVQTIHVARHRMVVKPALDNRAQPLPELHNWRVPAMPQLRLQRFELGRKALADGLSLDDEPTGLPRGPTHMREPEEVERLRLALASPPPLLDCVAIRSPRTEPTQSSFPI